MRVLVVIHIGLAKAGAAYIQSFLSANEAALRALSIDYPKIGRMRRKHHDNFASELQRGEDFDASLGTLEALYAHAAADTCTTRIISAGAFERLAPAEIDELQRMLRGFGHKFRIVMMIPDVFDLMASDYARDILHGQGIDDFDTFLENRIQGGLSEYCDIARKWADVFGWKRLAVRFLPPRPLLEGDLIDAFLAAAGPDMKHARIRALPRPGAASSTSGWKMLEALRALHGDRHGLERDHPLVAVMARAQRPADRRTIESAAVRVGSRLGWAEDGGLYLSRAQAERCIAVHRALVTAMSRCLPETPPNAPDLDARGFVERAFMPDVSHIAAADLRRFYDRVGDVVLASARAGPSAPTTSACVKSRGGPTWKFKSGATTFWNADPEDIVFPIIEPKPPALSEIAGAIITPRKIAHRTDKSKGSRKRIAEGAIYDRDGRLLPVFAEREAFEAGSGRGNLLKNPPTLSEKERSGVEILKGTYLYLGIFRTHFGHFLLESLSRAWSLLQADPHVGIIVHGHAHMDRLPSFVTHIFDLLDLDPGRIVTATRPLIVEHLLLPQSEFEIRWKGGAGYADLFAELHARNARLFPGLPTPGRVYLTRRRLPVTSAGDRKKHVRNEEDVEKVFAARGFEIVAPETMPFHRQIALIGGAGQIAGLKGSALHMSLFSQRRRARLIQLSRLQSLNQCIIDGVKAMDSHHIFCQSPASEHGGVVDMDMLQDALREM